MATKSGCEIRGCPDYKDGRCVNEEDYVSSLDGEPMCPHNESAVRRIEWVEAELTQAHAERDAARKALENAKEERYADGWRDAVTVCHTQFSAEVPIDLKPGD